MRAFVVVTIFAALSLSGPQIALPRPAYAEEFCPSRAANDQKPGVQINLVIDDSGSMIYDKKNATYLDRWSVADYSMQVLVALMRPNDQINVYRLSDFVENPEAGKPTQKISGSQPGQSRVESVQNIDFRGKYTAYAAVQTAYEDLKNSTSEEKWLVVVTDGIFQMEGEDGKAGPKVDLEILQKNLRSFAADQSEEAEQVNVAILALGGEDVLDFESDPKNRLFTARAANTSELLPKLTKFANQIFQRAPVIVNESDQQWETDIPLSRIDVFAQGQNVKIGALEIASGDDVSPEIVSVSWSDNPDVSFSGTGPITPKADESLQGVVATYNEAIPAGMVKFNIENAKTIDVFYTPNVFFGFTLTDQMGNQVDLDPDAEIESGNYTVNYGFMDQSCTFFRDSDLLRQGETEAFLTDSTGNDQPVLDGEEVTLVTGDNTLSARATFLDGSAATAVTPLKVKNSSVASFSGSGASYKVSELGNYPSLEKGVKITYVITDASGKRMPTPEEWEGLAPEDFTADSESKLDFEVIKQEAPGELILLPRAPDGDVYAADTGEISVEVGATRGIEGMENVTPGLVSIEVINDIDGFDRFMNWLKQSGWKWLLFLLGLILLAGYLFKKRFPKTMKKNPSISGTPNQVGTTPVNERGKFRPNSGRKLLPFVADTGTLTYVPIGTSGFKAFKLKAGPGKSMSVTNYKAIGEKENVEINGNPIDKETKRAPTFRANSTITASTPQMTYDCTPSQ